MKRPRTNPKPLSSTTTTSTMPLHHVRLAVPLLLLLTPLLAAGLAVKSSETLVVDLSDASLYVPNITYARIAFDEGKLSTIFYEPANATEVFIGGENIFHKLQFNPQTNKYHLLQSLSIGPKSDYRCNESEVVYLESETANVVTNILPDQTGTALWVCGTATNGLCHYISKANITQFVVFGHPCTATHLISSKASSVVLPTIITQNTEYGEKKKRLVYYVGIEYDDRNLKLFPPFVSLRMPFNNHNTFGFKLAGYDEDVNNTVGKIQLHPSLVQKHRIKFLNIFAWRNYVYFLTLQPAQPYSLKMETKLARVCKDDLELWSWAQMPLVCQHDTRLYSRATAGGIETQINDTTRGYRHEADYVAFDQVFVAFHEHSHNTSAVCMYNIEELNQRFDSAINECNYHQQPKVKLMAAINGKETLCKEQPANENGDYIFCNERTRANPYKDIETEMKAQAIVTVLHDKITSIKSVNMFKAALSVVSERNRKTMLLGTQASRVIAVQINDSGRGLIRLNYVNQLPMSEGAVSANSILYQQNASLMMLTAKAVYNVPLHSCSIFTSCSSCLNKESDCVWTKNGCTNKGNFKEGYSCPPEVYSFQPNVGPMHGGTMITFYGTNFGEEATSEDVRRNTRVNINVDNVNCVLIDRSNDRIKCRLPTRNETFNYRNNNGKILLEAVDRTAKSKHKRLYNIEGKIEVGGRFRFDEPSVRGIYPAFGPYAGGTEVLVYGTKLDIGSDHRVLFGEDSCDVTRKCPEYLVCKTIANLRRKTNQAEKEITVNIDGFTEVLNNSKGTKFNVQFNMKDDNSKCTDRFRPIEASSSPSVPWQTELMFNESFLFKSSPTIEVEDVHVLITGHQIRIIGDNFLSISHPPRFEIFYGQQRKRGPSYCDPVTSNNLFTCQVPELPDKDNQQAKIFFHLDGYKKSCNLKISNRLRFVADANYKINEDDRRLHIRTPTNWHRDFPITVLVNHTYPCVREKEDSDAIDCKLNVTNDELSELAGTSLPVTVRVGNASFDAGNAVIKTTNRKAFVALIFFSSLGIVLLVVYAFYTFNNYYTQNKLKKLKHRQSEEDEAKFHEEIREYLFNAFGNDVFYNELLASGRLILPQQIIDPKKCGGGHYSTVYKCTYNNRPVAIKAIKYHENQSIDNFYEYQRKHFLKEAEFMKDFKHENVISLAGITIFPNEPAIVTPFMLNGTLVDYIRQEVDITLRCFFEFALQVAKGMQYLADRNVVHRDLAARNVLIDEHFKLKISDFGLTREFNTDDALYQSQATVPLPFGWMAIESLNKGSFSTKSDVWSYGVLLWEILSRGMIPWGEVNTNDIPNLVMKGERLQSPSTEIIPDEVFMLAYKCWHTDPNCRPSFGDLVKEIELILREVPYEENQSYYSIRLPQNAPPPERAARLIPEIEYPAPEASHLMAIGSNASGSHRMFESSDMQIEMMPLGNDHNHNRANHTFFANNYNPRLEASV